jgi:phage baseplate assembly protein W
MSTAISSYNKSGYRSSIVSSTDLFSDLNLRFLKHPFKKDLVPLTDTDAIRSAVKNLVLTNYYERPFRPFIGGNVTAQLFENADFFTAIKIKESIYSVLNTYEPRINNIDIQVYDDIDNNAFRVDIIFSIIGKQPKYEVQFYLNRLR